ncbi:MULTISPECIES: GlxA family transcriptional regulator [Rhizobium]|uniref:GlxA family transcriptional regulator n=1 Tax=Rhizobium TaxID=379 RepID=UPI00103B7608|nr:helix-turn-helix domain-containing protein [Rhizobium leguminosarum]TCA07529.1 helix-turn-helix domain-containing protein [Rhizobium leguminosarum bv. viciae]UFW81150.1 helix-turn-helix domain-containing protein [Rhizobium leguminosarum bv. viciae]
MTDAAQPFDIPVFVVVPPRVLLLDVAGPIEVLRKANLEQRTVRFTATYIGPTATVGSSIGLAVTGVVALPERLPDNALVVIAGSADAPMANSRPWDEQERADQAAIVAWLKRAILPGIRLVSICSGALLAAEAGMLDGRDCTTHHACIEDLARLAPTARVRDNRLYVEDGDRLTSAGITAGIDLMLHIVAEAAGHTCALAVARYLVVYLRRGGSDPQLSPWLEGRNHIHPVIHRAQDAVVANPSQDWSVASLARLSGASPRNLSRLFNEQTGMSVTDFVNLMRVALAREMLSGSRLDMEDIAMRAGFGSARQLRRAWNRLNDGPPSAARSTLPTFS